MAYKGLVKKFYETAKMDQKSIEDFKCLIYTWGLQTMKDNEALLRCITRLESGIPTKLQDLMELLQTKGQARIVTKAPAVVAKFKKATQQENLSLIKKNVFFVWTKEPLEKQLLNEG